MLAQSRNAPFEGIFSKKKGGVGCCGPATPVHNTPHPDLLKRYFRRHKKMLSTTLIMALLGQLGVEWVLKRVMGELGVESK